MCVLMRRKYRRIIDVLLVMASATKLGGGALRELRIHLCQKSPSSSGVRAFIENDYVTLKKQNTNFPILIRECSGINPKIWARYVMF